MLRVRCRVAKSTIPNAGQGLFADEFIAKGAVIEYPAKVQQVISAAELLAMPLDSPELATTIRWFDDAYVADPQRSDTYFINHSFEPNCLWHLGFVFALEAIAPGTEITVDYRMLMHPDPEWAFTDVNTGRPIYGYSWEETILRGAEQLLALFRERAQVSAEPAEDLWELILNSGSMKGQKKSM